MAVLPPYSSHALPAKYKELMFDTQSEIVDFYPIDFQVDVKGKRFAWLGEVILPLIDENRLKTALNKLAPFLSEEEQSRNEPGSVLVFEKASSHKIEEFNGIYGSFEEVKAASEKKLIFGDSFVESLLEGISMKKYTLPEFTGHSCKLLEGVHLRGNGEERDLFDYNQRNRTSAACIRIIENNLSEKYQSRSSDLKKRDARMEDEEVLAELRRDNRKLKRN
jgi:5'-3' exonuclease